jgi:putative ubiquitin-RnfH superfamily antitoxin RatB of RatAB toxin-antitoxin module
MKVCVVFAGVGRHHVLEVEVPAGATVAQALLAARLPELDPGFDFASAQLGVWSRRVTAATLLRAGDRVEVYRPLTIEPKEARRRRADVRRRRG